MLLFFKMSDNEDVGNPYRHLSFYRNPPPRYLSKRKAENQDLQEFSSLAYSIPRDEWIKIRRYSFLEFNRWFDKKCQDFLDTESDVASEDEDDSKDDSAVPVMPVDDASPASNEMEP